MLVVDWVYDGAVVSAGGLAAASLRFASFSMPSLYLPMRKWMIFWIVIGRYTKEQIS